MNSIEQWRKNILYVLIISCEVWWKPRSILLGWKQKQILSSDFVSCDRSRAVTSYELCAHNQELFLRLLNSFREQ